MQDKRGQNVVEFILLAVAVIMVCLVLLKPQGPFKKAVETSLNSTVNQIDHITDDIQFSSQ